MLNLTIYQIPASFPRSALAWERGGDGPGRSNGRWADLGRLSGRRVVATAVALQPKLGLEAVGLDLHEVEGGHRLLLGQGTESVFPRLHPAEMGLEGVEAVGVRPGLRHGEEDLGV